MPGFTLIYQPDGLSESIVNRANRLVEASFKINFISKTDDLILLFRDGNHYPYEIIETNHYIAIVEGKIYDIANYADKTFRQKIDKIYNGENSDQDLAYFYELDGEFIIYILDKNGEKHFVINDYLGRLPAYRFQGRQFILSRDIYVLDKITTGLIFDEQSIYQFLRLGYPLGERTLYEDIERFPPASLLSVQKEKINIESYPPNVLEMEGTYSGLKPEDALYDIFKQALRDRFKNEEKVVLSLSGGLDSRVIMGEAVKSNYPVDYATFDYDNAIIRNDIKAVKQLAKHYEKSPQFIELKEWVPELFDEMISVKGGMNYVGMSFILEFLKQLGATHTLMLTGDGGDKTLPGLLPLKAVNNNNINKYILNANRITTITDMSSFVTFEIGAHEKELKQILKSQDGTSANMKYKHFQLFERALHWLFEGEDRNRNYIWSTSPFYNPDFFKLAHSVSEKEKKNFKLFRKFIDLVDPELNNIPNANWEIPLGDEKKVNRMFWRQKMKSRIPFRLNRPDQHPVMHEQLVWYISGLLQKGYGGQVLINADKYDLKATNTDTLFHLLTLLKVSEMSWKQL